MKHLFFTYLFALMPCLLLAQNTDYQINVTSFTEKDGLSNNDVFCINKDVRGVLWVGTRYGLNRFDGKGFRAFTAADGLKNNFVSSIFPIGERYLLLGLGEPQADMIFSKNFQFFDAINFTIVSNLEEVLPLVPFKRSAIDYILPQENGFLFVLKNHQNFFLSKQNEWTRIDFIKKNEKILAYFPKKYTWIKHLQNDTISLQKRDCDGKLLFSKTVGVVAIDILTWLRTDAKGNAYFKYYELRPNYPVRILRITNSGKIQTVHTFRLEDFKNYFLADCITYSPVLKASWGSNLHRTVLFSDDWQPLWEVSSAVYGIITQYRQSYFSANAIWQCSSKGLQHIVFNKKRFAPLFIEEKSMTFRGILRMGDRLLFNSEKGLWEKKNNNITQINPLFFLSSTRIGNDFFASPFHEIYRFDQNNKIKKVYETKNNEIWSMWGDDFGGLWWSGGSLRRLDLETGVSTDINYEGFEILAEAAVYHFYPLSKNRVWLCTTEGLFEFDPQRQKIKARYWTGGKGKYYLPTNDLRHLYHDKKTGVFWFATGQTGLLRWQPRTSTTQIFSFSNNATNITHAVYADKFGFLWLPTDNGIVQFERDTERFRIYRQGDGLHVSEFNRISHFQDTDGSFYFGTTNGVVHFYPQDFKNALERKATADIFVVEALQYEGKKDTVANKTADLLAQNRLIIRPQDRFFTLTFGLNDYALAKDAVYFYQVKGDATWQISDKNQLTFWRLPYGRQTIFVKARLTNGDFTKVLPISVWVKRPFYLQFWFILLLIVLVAAAIFGWVDILRKQNQKLEVEVTRRTEKIERQADELQQLDEMKSRFFANISHELRTPLTLILNPLNRLLKNKKFEEEDARELLAAQKNSQKLLRLVNEILDLTKLEAATLNIETQEIELLGFIRRIAAEFESFAARKNVVVKVEHSLSETVNIATDVRKVETILYNFIGNALKFTPQNGEILIRITVENQDLQIEVSDTGRGIKAEDLPYIFDRFYQSKTNGTSEGGSGLGLALSRELAQLLKGAVWARSEWGEGSRFFVRLPNVILTKKIGDANAQTVQQSVISVENYVETDAENDAEKLAIVAKKDRYQILLVEDNFDLQDYISTILETRYEVIVKSDGKEAFDYLENLATAEELPHLILSDVMMPIMDGYQLLNLLKTEAKYQKIPVIMLTARAGLEDKLKALRIGVDDYLTKPFVEIELLTRIENLLKNAVLRKQAQTEMDEEGGEEAEGTLSEWLKEVEAMIYQNMAKPDFSIEALSEMLGISRQKLNRDIKKEVGVTTLQYVQEIKFQYARKMLEEGKVQSVKAVAEHIGITDIKHFARLFKTRFGRLPSEYLL